MTNELAHFFRRNRTSIIRVSFVMLRPLILTHRKSNFLRLFHFKFLGTRCIIGLDGPSSVVRRSKRMRLVPIFILETNNQTNNEVSSAQVRPYGSYMREL